MDGSSMMMRPRGSPLCLRARVAIIGAPTAGKTALVTTFVEGPSGMPKNYVMTTGVSLLIKQVPLPDSAVSVELYLLDCGGGEAFADLVKPQMETCNSVLFVYDASSPESFKQLKQARELVASLRGEAPLVGAVVAAKSDLVDRATAVKAEAGAEFAKSHGLLFFETSAAKNEVNAPFHWLAEEFHERYEAKCEELLQLVQG